MVRQDLSKAVNAEQRCKWNKELPCGYSGTTPPGRENKHKSPETADFHSSSEERQDARPIRVIRSGLQCLGPTGKTHGAATGPPVPVQPQGECLTLRNVAQLLRCQCDPPVDGTRGTLRPQFGIKMPNPARLTSPNSEDFRAGESDVPGLAPGYKGLRRNRGRFSHLCVNVSPRGPFCAPPRLPLDHLIPEFNVFAFSRASVA